MGEVICVLSGKGGTGKTTISAALATCLAKDGKRVLCIDADIGLRNLDIALGMTDQPAIAFTDVLRGDHTLKNAAKHPKLPTLSLLTAPFRIQDLDLDAFGKLLKEVRKSYDFCLIDAPAGIGKGFQLASHYADHCLVVSTPDPASMRDAGRAAELLRLDGKQELHLIVNRITKKMFSKMKLTVDDMMDDVGLPLLGIVPEDPEVVLAAASGQALIFTTNDGAAEACLRISRRLCGALTPLMKL